MPNSPRRPSLSASFGSWFFSLAYNPRPLKSRLDTRKKELENVQMVGASARKRDVSRARLLFPAFASAFVGVAAACFALESFVSLGHITTYLSLILLMAGTLAFGSQCASGNYRTLCRVARWLVGAILIGLAFSVRYANLLPIESDSETNTLVAVLVGFVAVLTLLFVGAQSGERAVPILAPLVPCLSLFGLLCLISVDARVQLCFLIFLLSALYLLTYDRYLRRVCPEISTGLPRVEPIASWPTRAVASSWARQSLGISVLWFAAFFGVGLMLFLPVRMFLPQVMNAQISKVRAAAQGLHLNFRGASTTIELKGGSYALSDREILKVTLTQGEPSGLWRGRVFNYYDRSRWEEEAPFSTKLASHFKSTNDQAARAAFRESQFLYPRTHHAQIWSSRVGLLDAVKPTLRKKQGRVREVLEIIEPCQPTLTSLYSSGLPLSWQAHPEVSLENDGNETRSMSYTMRSFVVEPNWLALSTTPGISPQVSEYPQFRATLQLPDDPNERRLLSLIARQIRMGHRGDLLQQTPQTKVQAISMYLAQNCTYSLASPQVPPTRDAVTFFLLESRQGACDMFASSMVLLLREMKVPARLVSGYLQPDEALEKTEEGRLTYTLRERDAHAWVEYFVPGFGWLPYDPTQNTQTAAETLPSQFVKWFDFPSFDIPAPLLYLPSLGFAFMALGLRRNGREKTAHTGRVARDLTRESIEANYFHCVKALRHKVPHQRHLTPGEFESRVHCAAISPIAKGEFAALTHLYNAARYGETPDVSPKEVTNCARRFRAALRSGRRK